MARRRRPTASCSTSRWTRCWPRSRCRRRCCSRRAPWPSESWWYAALPGAIAALLLAGLPVRLPQQYWRYAGLPDLLGVVVAAAGGGGAVLGRAARARRRAAAEPGLPGDPRAGARHAARPAAGGRPHAPRPPRAGRRRASRKPCCWSARATARTSSSGRWPASDRPATAWSAYSPCAPARRGGASRATRSSAPWTRSPTVLEAMRQDGRLPALIVLTTRACAGPGAANGCWTPRTGTACRCVARPPSPRSTRRRSAATTCWRKAPRRACNSARSAIEELLDRPQVPLDREGMARLIQGRRVLVTGAGGTIGGELARQVAALGPGALILLDHGEYVALRDRPGAARDATRTCRAARCSPMCATRRASAACSRRSRPELVFHAAALKHVPMVENDPLEGLLTNALGTRVVADAARAVGHVGRWCSSPPTRR